MAVLTTYARRGSRFADHQQAAWDRWAEHWFIPDEVVDAPDFDLSARFGRPAPLVVEIGSGIGEALSVLAADRPELNVVGFEVWRPGVAETFLRLERSGVTNVRMLSVDAVWSIRHLFEPDSIAELWTFFPDPWPKKKHHKRRLVGPAFTALAATRLVPGGVWRLATDWPPYAEQMMAVLDAEPLLSGGVVERWPDRPRTKFERRGDAAGRPIVDLSYRRQA